MADGSRVRLIGIDTPERGACWYTQATQTLAALTPPGAAVTLIPDRTDVDRYGRLLRYVETADAGDVGAQLVAGGHARSRRYPPDTARSGLYDQLQTEAQAAGRGQWGAC